MNEAARDSGPLRTCVVSRQERPPEEMIRFVRGPDGTVVPDLRRRLPGRGVWTIATAQTVKEAVKRRAFDRGFKVKTSAPEDLAGLVDRLLEADCLQSLSLANKAGLAVTGYAKIEAAIAGEGVAAVFHALDGGADGKRKLRQALWRRFGAAAPIEIETFDSCQLGLALGRTNVIHAALRSGPASAAALARRLRLHIYRSGAIDVGQREIAASDGTNGLEPRTQDE